MMPEVCADIGTAVSLGEALERSAAALRVAGISEARREARWLVAAALGLPSEALIVRPEAVLVKAQQDRLADWLARRVAREPLWRIAGERAFYGRKFALSSATLEPRPDSETVITAVLDIVKRFYPGGRPVRILDVGTGTGCLLISLLAELPQAFGVGTDVSEAALVCAAANASALDVADRASWRLRRSLEGIDETFDVLVSNPPYVPTREIELLAPEVRLYDPGRALDGGADGLDVYREIATRIGAVVPDGFVVFEVGKGQHQQVGEILKEWLMCIQSPEIETHRDMSGHVRCVTMRTQQGRHA
jgi:release factor glutamine methyltransferase